MCGFRPLRRVRAKFEDKIDLDGVVGVQKNLDTAKERPVRVVTA
jgi:hypothetical protein